LLLIVCWVTTLEVLERSVAHEVAVLTVLQWAVSPASAVEGVVLHGDDVHDEGNEVPRQNPLGNLYPAEQRNIRKHVNRRNQVTG
jgi:predicted alpha/beta hydrolase family esterase